MFGRAGKVELVGHVSIETHRGAGLELLLPFLLNCSSGQKYLVYTNFSGLVLYGDTNPHSIRKLHEVTSTKCDAQNDAQKKILIPHIDGFLTSFCFRKCVLTSTQTLSSFPTNWCFRPRLTGLVKLASFPTEWMRESICVSQMQTGRRGEEKREQGGDAGKTR